MSVLAIFTYDVKPGRVEEFMTKLAAAASPKFDSEAMPQAVRLYRAADQFVLHIEYENMAVYEARTAFEKSNAEWQELFAAKADSPESLVSVQLLTEIKH